MDDYTEQKVNDALFDHHDENQEEVEEAKEEVKEEEVKEEVPEVVETVETPEVVEQSEEQSCESLLTELDSVKSDKWRSLLKFDTEGVKSAMEKEREVRDNLKKMNWWYACFLNQGYFSRCGTNTQFIL